jgi:hypothetical protein
MAASGSLVAPTLWAVGRQDVQTAPDRGLSAKIWFVVATDLLDPSSGASGGGLNLRHLGRLWWTSWDGGQYPPVRESDLDASSLPPL